MDVLGAVGVAVLCGEVLRERPRRGTPILGSGFVYDFFKAAEPFRVRFVEVFIELRVLSPPILHRVLADAAQARGAMQADTAAHRFD